VLLISWLFIDLRTSRPNSSVCPLYVQCMHTNLLSPRVIAGFRREVAKNCAVLGYYASSSGNFLPAFRDNLSVHPQGSKIHFWTLRMGQSTS